MMFWSLQIYSFIKDFNQWSTNNDKVKPILVAHNARFDSRFFKYIYDKIFPDSNTKYFWIDTLSIFDKVEVDSNVSGKTVSLEALVLHHLDDTKVIDLHNAETDVELLFELLMLKFKSKEEIIKYCVEYRQEKLGVKRKKSTQSGQRLCKKCGEPGHYQKNL